MSGLSNPTESCPKLLAKRAAYIAAHKPYLGYVGHLLETATLPPSEVALPNLTTMAALLEGLRTHGAASERLNPVVLGRVLHRVFPGLLTWHGGRHVKRYADGMCVTQETSIYRLPEVQRCRGAFAEFLVASISWPNDFDQWQWTSRGEEWE